jgi:folate-dependent phosphoribosylglycinamide formyltransferase PurN
VFSEASQVAIVCADIRKGGMKIRSDKDLRKLKKRVSEREAKIVVLNVTKLKEKRKKKKKATTITMMTMMTKTRL